MARRKTYNPEKRAWRGKSHKKGGERISRLRELGAELRELAEGLGEDRVRQDMVEHAAELCEDASSVPQR